MATFYFHVPIQRGGGGGGGGQGNRTSSEKSQNQQNLKGVLWAGRQWPAFSAISILFPHIKRKKKRYQSWTPSGKTFWICACTFAMFLISMRSMYSSLLRILTDFGYMVNFTSITQLCLLLSRKICCVCKKSCTALEWQ